MCPDFFCGVRHKVPFLVVARAENTGPLLPQASRIGPALTHRKTPPSRHHDGHCDPLTSPSGAPEVASPRTEPPARPEGHGIVTSCTVAQSVRDCRSAPFRPTPANSAGQNRNSAALHITLPVRTMRPNG